VTGQNYDLFLSSNNSMTRFDFYNCRAAKGGPWHPSYKGLALDGQQEPIYNFRAT